MILLPENTHLKIEQIQVHETVTLSLSSTETTALCPSCHTMALHIHSRYQRRLRDLPVSGHPVTLLVEVRRFFCQHPSCPRKTFAEAFPFLTRRYAQRTNRFEDALEQLGLALGGEIGARVGARLGLASSPASLLRVLRAIHLPTPPAPSVIGIDDWAYKRKRRYGTLLCDLETGKPIDMLPDRNVHTVRTWLQAHPEVKVISRDRWSEYATAAQQGAPQAIQVADRWHLLHNLTESVSALFPRIRAEVCSSAPAKKSASSTQKARQQQYQELLALAQQGVRPEQIAPRIGVSERTAYRWLAQATVPSWQHQSRSSSVIDPYQSYLLKRWQEGCRKGSVLFRALKAQGYHGSERAVYRYLAFLHAQFSSESVPHVPRALLSRKTTTWLLMKEPGTLDEEEQESLSLLRESSATADAVYHLVQDFGAMVRLRQGEKLDGWLAAVESCAMVELQAFAAGIQRDKAAVQAGLTLPYSNGVLEGHVNRLKLIKRSMYGRAHFDLLRLRVLSAV